MTRTAQVVVAWWRARTAAGERGGILVEYAFLVFLIAVVALTAVAFLGDRTADRLDSSADSIQDAGG